MKKRSIAVAFLCALLLQVWTISTSVHAQTNGWIFPSVATYSSSASDNAKGISSTNAPGASLTVNLPAIGSLPVGWEVTFGTDNGKGFFINPPGGVFILAGQKTVTSLSIPSNTNYEFVTLSFDGTNFRLKYATRATLLLNGLIGDSGGESWTFLFSTGYSATVNDNGHTLSSALTGGPTTVTLPSTSTIPSGWTIELYVDNGNSITLQVNGVSGGSIYSLSGSSASSFTIPTARSPVHLSFDGSNFRVLASGIGNILGPTSSIISDIPLWNNTTGSLLKDAGFGLTSLGCPSITIYGGKGDNSTDNTSALNAALAANPSGPCVYFPFGKYVFNSSISYTLPSDGVGLTIMGSGRETSQLIWPNASGGMTITYAGHQNGVHIEGLTFATGTTGGGTGLTLTQTTVGSASDAPTTLRDLGFRGSDGYAVTDYWNTGVRTNGINNVNVISSQFAGSGTFTATGLDLEGLITANGAVYNIIASNFYCLNNGIVYGNYIQGVTVSGGSNFVCGNVGILASGTLGTDQLSVTGSQFEMSVAGIRDTGGINGTLIHNNLFINDRPNSIGIDHQGNATFSVTGNEFQVGTAGGFGIKVGTGLGIISNNNFIDQGTDIFLGVGSGQVRVPDTNNHLAPFIASVTNSNAGNTVDGAAPWTPTFIGSSVAGSPTYNIQNGSYYRTGAFIIARFHIGITALGGLSGNVQIGGLPFPDSTGLEGTCSLAYVFGILPSANSILTGVIGTTLQLVKLYNVNGTSSAQVTNTQLTAPVEVIGTCSYTL